MSNFLIPDSAKEKTIIKACLTKRIQLTKNDNRTFLLSLEFDDEVNFKSGDSFAIFPQNHDDDVFEFLKALKLPTNAILDSGISAYDFLKNKTSLSKWSSKLSQLIFNEQKLPEALQNLSPLEILKNIDITPEVAKQLIQLLPPQMPRYYSIASSPQVNSRGIDLLVSLNRFENEGKLCYGLASAFLCLNTPLNTSLHGFIHSADHFRVAEQDLPIIMIGPGTGVAPFRAFIQERIKNKMYKNWLFFGERSKKSDFYFEEEFTQYASDQQLILSLAFSRDQDHKIYVQDLINTHKKEFYTWINAGAIIYICGDAKKMAKDVEIAIISVFQEFENIEFKEAQMKLRTLKKEKRYNLDVY